MMAPKPGDMSALAIAAAKLSASGNSSTSRSRRKDLPTETNDNFASYQDSHRSREEPPRTDDALVVFDESPLQREACKSYVRSAESFRKDNPKSQLVFDHKSEAKKDSLRKRGESPLRFDDSPTMAPKRDERAPPNMYCLDDQVAPEVRMFKALTAVPQDLSFTVPPNYRAGQPVCIQGPHGPMRVPLPQGYQPGERCIIRFGPTVLHQVTVPKGFRPGDIVKFKGDDGQELEAVVPVGKEPGDLFEVSPPVLMVQVPEGAVEGDLVCFQGPTGAEVRARVPKGMKAMQYFAARIDV